MNNTASRDYVDARTAEAKSSIVTTTATLLFAGVGLIIASFVALMVYLHHDAKQERQELKQDVKAIKVRLDTSTK